MSIRQPAIRRKTPGLQKDSTKSLPAPVKGWNARDPLAAMNEQYAIALENFFPTAFDVMLRPGAVEFQEGFLAANKPLTLLPWNGPASSILFAATDTGIYDITAGTTLPAASTTVTNGRLQFTNFSIVGGHYLVTVNGTDDMQVFDGTDWLTINAASTPALTGVATADLDFVAVLKRRLWFVEKDSSSAWYLPVASIAGAAAEFPLGQIFPRGGHLVAIASWTIDGGDGQDDYGVFVSSEGEIAIYKGTDPASSTTWNLVGTFYIGEPLGKNCLCKYGGDLLFLSRNGLYPLSKALQSATIDRSQSLTSVIDPAFTDAVALYGDNPGWSTTVFPEAGFILVNVPISGNYCWQFVMNTITSAWCKITGWVATSWLVWQEKLYFSGPLRVGRAWTSRNDFGAPIQGRAQQAYSYLDFRARQKHLKLIRPLVSIDQEVTLRLGLDTDYQLSLFSTLVEESPDTSSQWDKAIWDESVWVGEIDFKRDWSTIFAREFFAAAFRLQITTSIGTLRWSATDFAFEVGGIL